MIGAAYLEQDAAALGDREHSRIKPTSQHIIDELEYASTLFKRAERAIAAELNALEAAGIDMGGFAAQNVCCRLAGLSALAGIRALILKEARANGL